MPFDPALPANGSKIRSGELRGQFTGLKDLIDAGPPTDVVGGVPKLVLRDLFLYKAASPSQNLVDGNPGTLQQVVHDANPGFAYSVNLGAPADITTIKIAGNGVDGSFPGDVAADIRYSDDGATWTVIGSFIMDADNGTLQPFTFPSVGAHQYWGFIVTGYEIPGHGSDASLSEMQGFDGITAVLAPEATAEVQAAAAADATAKADAAQAASSHNTNAVATLDEPFHNDPPTLADLELMRAKQNELILALRT